MSRSTYKLSFSKLNISKKNYIKKKIFSKSEIITENLYNKEIEIYNGVRYIKVKILPEMGGQKLGTFISTRKICIYKRKSVQKAKGKKGKEKKK
jgi:ribosomal protein S19